MSKAVVLINLGTPRSHRPRDVGKFLNEFLMDPLVMQMPYWQRVILVRGIIAPFRKRQSAQKYEQIWTEKGSPLLVHSEELALRAQQLVGEKVKVFLGMRYGEPSLLSVIQKIQESHITDVRVVPLFPQYAESSYLSAQQKWQQLWESRKVQGKYSVLPPFFGQDYFVSSLASLAKSFVAGGQVDHWIMTYHGLPESHILSAVGSPEGCLQSKDCCDDFTKEHWRCYRAQAHHTSLSLARKLELSQGDWTMTFQSRLGRGKWLSPSTEEVVLKKASQGARRFAILSPSFVTDGLETLEEIGLGLKKQFLEAGGEELLLVPCLNDNVDFVSGLMKAAVGEFESS